MSNWYVVDLLIFFYNMMGRPQYIGYATHFVIKEIISVHHVSKDEMFMLASCSWFCIFCFNTAHFYYV